MAAANSYGHAVGAAVRNRKGSQVLEHAVVAGGAGFIGSHLCAALIERGFAVTCLDNFSTGREENVAALRGMPQFRLCEVDITCSDLFAATGDAFEPPSYIFHLASPASVVDYMRLPLETMRVNSEGTWRLLDAARSWGSRLLLASTSEIYGDPLEHPQRESYWGNVNPNGLRSCYDESKRFGEALCAQYVRSYGVDARIVRIFNTYGPHSRIDDGRVVPNFVAQALRGEPITVYGDGRQTRSFCYVSDLVAGLQAVMFARGKQGEVFNLGNPHEQTISEFAETVARICAETSTHAGDGPRIEWRELPVDDPTRRRPDIGKARADLGWEPRVSLEAGLRETIAWFRSRVDRAPLATVGAGDAGSH